MHRLIPVLALIAALAGPAHAWDASNSGRYGGLDLDTLDVGKVRLQEGGSSGDVSGMSVAAGGVTRPLSGWFTPSGIRGLLTDVFPGLAPNLFGGRVPGIMGDNAGFWIYQTKGRDNIPLRVQRDVDPAFTGDGFNGVSAPVYPAIWGVVGSGQNDRNFSVAVLGQLHNRTNVAVAPQNVAVNGTVFKETTGGVNSYQVGPSWGMNAVCGDKTGVQNPVASCIGIEIDNYAERTAGTDANRQRVGAQIAWGPSGTPPDQPVHFGYGILMGGAPNSNVIMDRGISLRSDGGGVFGIGIDLVTGVFSGPAIQMAPNQFLAFDADDAGNWSRSLYYTAGTFAYRRGTTNLLQITDTGDGAFSGSINAPSFRSGSATGVTCAQGSVNIATLQVTNGIVTHC